MCRNGLTSRTPSPMSIGASQVPDANKAAARCHPAQNDTGLPRRVIGIHSVAAHFLEFTSFNRQLATAVHTYLVEKFPMLLTPPPLAADRASMPCDICYGTGYRFDCRYQPRFAVWVYRPGSWVLHHLGAVADISVRQIVASADIARCREKLLRPERMGCPYLWQTSSWGMQ